MEKESDRAPLRHGDGYACQRFGGSFTSRFLPPALRLPEKVMPVTFSFTSAAPPLSLFWRPVMQDGPAPAFPRTEPDMRDIDDESAATSAKLEAATRTKSALLNIFSWFCSKSSQHQVFDKLCGLASLKSSFISDLVKGGSMAWGCSTAILDIPIQGQREEPFLGRKQFSLEEAILTFGIKK